MIFENASILYGTVFAMRSSKEWNEILERTEVNPKSDQLWLQIFRLLINLNLNLEIPTQYLDYWFNSMLNQGHLETDFNNFQTIMKKHGCLRITSESFAISSLFKISFRVVFLLVNILFSSEQSVYSTIVSLSQLSHNNRQSIEF